MRLERKEEYREVENLVRESFWNVYWPGCLEHYVSKEILISMERVDLHTPATLVFATTDCQRGRMRLSFYVKN